jgi:hypothetical protein
MTDNYYDDFLDSNESENNESEGLPDWVSPNNSSLKAYEAIEEIKKEKKKYIRRNGLKSQYVKKSNYQIQKSEVARSVGAKPQPLFNSCSYSESLSRHLDAVNKQLDEAREKRIKNKGGLRQKKKELIIKELQEANHKNDNLLTETVDKVFERTMNNMPLDIKRKLGLGV